MMTRSGKLSRPHRSQAGRLEPRVWAHPGFWGAGCEFGQAIDRLDQAPERRAIDEQMALDYRMLADVGLSRGEGVYAPASAGCTSTNTTGSRDNSVAQWKQRTMSVLASLTPVAGIAAADIS
jgi:hypothetical protein